MRIRWKSVVFVVATGLIFAADNAAHARRKAKSRAPAPAPTLTPVQAPPPQLETYFDGTLPMSVSTVPAGLANLSAQGCNACHYESHDTWAVSAHANSSHNQAFFQAVQQAGTPACLVCHLPLDVQQPELVVYEQGDINHPTTSLNPSFDATTFSEGVTCAACHLRDGLVVTSRPIEEAPHPTIWSPELTTSSACASCHQLTWEGADLPIYDTYGEWQRSAYAKAGVECQDCHMRSGTLGHGTTSHAMHTPSARAISVLTDVSTLSLARGGAPITVTVTIQNTGAGHSFPTGSPFKGVRLEVFLEGPPSSGATTTQTTPFQIDLVRQVESSPPFQTLSDSRIAAGQQVRWSSTHQLGFEAPSGAWSARVRLSQTVNGFIVGKPIFDSLTPLIVD